jgi:PAT family beta-lactamase induction signal transducer AmpG
LVGFAYGLSFPLTLAILGFWLKDVGVSNAVIGAFSIFHLPFVFKFVWGVFIENYDVPYLNLSKTIGRNRSWVMVGYLILVVGIVGMSFSDPKSNLLQLMLFASLASLGDGCKDVALYSYQIDGTTKDHLGYVASAVGFGQKIGMIIAKVGVMYLAYFFSWKTAYLVAAIAIFAQMIMVFFLKAPPEHHDELEKSLKSLFFDSIRNSLIIPFRDMMKETSNLIIVIIFYKSLDFMMQNMSRVFLVEVGFSKIEIANVQLLGSIVVIIGGLFGGYIIKKKGLGFALSRFSIMHAICFGNYASFLKNGADILTLNFLTVCEAFTGGCVTTAFVALFYVTCKTGSMYALFWALHEISGIFFMGISGIVVDKIGWKYFFQFVPGFYLIILLLWALIGGQDFLRQKDDC